MKSGLRKLLPFLFRGAATPPPKTAEECWTYFRENYYRQYKAWDQKPSAGKYSLPIKNLNEDDPDSKKIMLDLNGMAVLSSVLIRESLKDVLRAAETEIWIAKDIEPYARARYKSEKEISRALRENQTTVASFIFPSEFTKQKPVIMLLYGTLQQHEQEPEISNYYLRSYAHEAGHILASALNNFNESGEFQAAYAKDLLALQSDSEEDLLSFYNLLKSEMGIGISYSKSDLNSLIIKNIKEKKSGCLETFNYFLPAPYSENPVSFSSNEAFAEIVAALQFRGPALNQTENAILKALFPHSFAVVGKVLERLDQEVKAVQLQCKQEYSPQQQVPA